MKNFKNNLFIVLSMILLTNMASCSPVVATAAATAAPPATSLPTPSPAPTIQPGDLIRELRVNDSNRKYYVHIPPGLDLDHPAPVVLFFHGLHSVAITRSTTHFDETADKNQFIAVYPVGIGSSWNAGDCCGIAVEDKVDEITFVRQILSDLGTIASIDPKRIYATGSYNGGMISYRLACEMSDTLAAIAPVTGTQVFGECQPEQPVSILHIHGLSDPYVPYRGGSSLEGSIADLPSVEQGIETWSRLNECTDSPEVKVEGAVTHTSYTCQAGTAIELYILEGLEGWPLKFPTNQTIWDFFAAHPKS